MSIATFVFLGIFAALFLYAVTMYNNFVRLKNNVAQAWSNVDVLLKQRHDELPKLVDACRQYMQHERGVLEKVTEARAAVHSAREAGDVGSLGAAETELRAGLSRLFAVAENYPELRANENFQHLHRAVPGQRDRHAVPVRGKGAVAVQGRRDQGRQRPGAVQ